MSHLRRSIHKIDEETLFDCLYLSILAVEKEMGRPPKSHSEVDKELQHFRDGGTTIKRIILSGDLENDPIFCKCFLIQCRELYNLDENTDRRKALVEVMTSLEEILDSSSRTSEQIAQDYDYAEYWIGNDDFIRIPDVNIPVSKHLQDLDKNIALIIIDQEGRPIGILTQSDLIKKSHPNSTIGEIMTPNPQCWARRALMKDIYARFTQTSDFQHKIKHAPIVDQDGRLVGLVTLVETILWRGMTSML